MSNDKFILDEHRKPVKEPNLLKWATWFKNADRTVAKTEIASLLVSTVFLGLDHNFSEGPPILWETMVFNNHESVYQNRCSGSIEQAEAMHQKTVEMVQSGEI